MNKKECLQELAILKKSCEEGMDGTWDCSTQEGREGFEAMIRQIEDVQDFIKGSKIKKK